jgi:hypothetical protein
MRIPRPTRRFVATLGAAGVLAALATPAAALASDAHVQGGGSGDCDLLVTHRPTGSEGDPYAVAITSQALEAGQAGWASVGWEAAGTTTVDSVHVVRQGRTERRVGGDLSTGHAKSVIELRFCGRTGDTAAHTAAAPVTEPAGTDPAPEPEPVTTERTAPAVEPEPPAESPSPEPPAAPESSAPQQEAAATERIASKEPRAEDPEAREEVEVLGVSRWADGSHEIAEPDPTRRAADVLQATPAATETNTGQLLAGGLAGALAAGAALLGARRLHVRKQS